MDTVLVTGASTGLGLAVARRLLAENYHVVLTARPDSLGRFKTEGISPSDRIWIRPLDVTNETQREELIREMDEDLGGVDVLINNAGVAYRSVVEHEKEKERLAQMDVNYRGPMELIRLALPLMREKRRGRIVNVSSVGGMMAMPTMAVYSASKFALEGATEALYYEVRPWNIRVSLVEPGFINSSSFQRVQYTDLSNKSLFDKTDPYYAHYINMEPFIERMMSLSIATPEKVASTIMKTIGQRSPPLRVSASIDAMIFDLMRRFIPRRLYHWILYRNLPHVKEWGPPGQ